MKCQFFMTVRVNRSSNGEPVSLMPLDLFINRPHDTGVGVCIEVELDIPLEYLEPKVIGTIETLDIAEHLEALKKTARELERDV